MCMYLALRQLALKRRGQPSYQYLVPRMVFDYPCRRDLRAYLKTRAGARFPRAQVEVLEVWRRFPFVGVL